MAWIMAGVIGGSALLGAGASIYGANQQSSAAQNALGFQQGVYNQNQQNAKPYISAGNDALGRLNESYSNPGSFLNTPDYAFGRDQGFNALQNSAAARGGADGGNFARSATMFGQNYATNYLSQYRAGLSGIAGMGANAASGNANANNSSANMIGNSMNYLGGANASGAVGAANALTGGAQNYAFLNALGKSSYSGNGDTTGGMQPLWDAQAASTRV